MCTLTLKISWGLALSDWANVCNQVQGRSQQFGILGS